MSLKPDPLAHDLAKSRRTAKELAKMAKTLIAIPVFNEEKYARKVLERVLSFNPHVLVVDDGSTDNTPHILPDFPVEVIRHSKNRGYGKSLKDAFAFSIQEKYDYLITMDCDEQHEPDAIPHFIDAISASRADIISGSRYLLSNTGNDRPPPERREINSTITAELNCRLSSTLGTLLTDSFCGFKAYNVRSLASLHPTVSGYAFPMQFWVQAAAAGHKVKELPVRLIYNDLSRTFGGQLDDAKIRLAHYRHILHRELLRLRESLPAHALRGLGLAQTQKHGENESATMLADTVEGALNEPPVASTFPAPCSRVCK